MSEIRILILIHVMPDRTNVITIFFQNFLNYLKTRSKIHLIWVVCMPEKISPTNNQNSDESIIDFHNYKNAYEIIKKEKPDLIYASPDWAFIDYAFSSAAKYYNIPVFFMTPNIDTKLYTRKNIASMILNFKRFFESSIPTDTNLSQKQLFKTGRFFLKKYLFLIKTQFRLKNDIFLTLFGIWKYILTGVTDYRFASNTIQFLENEQMKHYMIERGFKNSNLIVSGNPMYDLFFKKTQNYELNIKNPRILFTPSTAFEHGFWTINQRDFTTKQIVNEISEKNNLELIIKIHPSTSILSEYASIINSIDSSISVYQKSDIQEYLENVDLVITFQSSTVEVYAIISRKPIIICNFFQSQRDILVEQGMAVECTDPSNLVKLIEQISHNSEYDKNVMISLRNFSIKQMVVLLKEYVIKSLNYMKKINQ